MSTSASPTPSTGVIVRHATREDVPSILSLIHALALYEKEPDAVKATPASLLATLSFATSTSASTSSEVLEPISPQRPARALLLFAPSASPSVPGKTPSTSNPTEKSEAATQAVALALYFHNYSTWLSIPGIYLEDLFVIPSARGHGYGTILLGKLAELALELGGGRLEWSVLKWNEPSIGFYKSLGAAELEEWVGMRVEGGRALEGLVGRGEGVWERHA